MGAALMASIVYYDAYTAKWCRNCGAWLPDDGTDPYFEAHHMESAHPEYDGHPPFMFWNEFDVTDKNPTGLTPCCGALLKGTEDGLRCRSCFKLY